MSNELKCGMVRLTVFRAKLYKMRSSYQYGFFFKRLSFFSVYCFACLFFFTHHQINSIYRLAGGGDVECVCSEVYFTDNTAFKINIAYQVSDFFIFAIFLLFTMDVSYKEKILNFSNFTETDLTFGYLNVMSDQP